MNGTPTMTREEMADDYTRLKREYALLHEDYRGLLRVRKKQLLTKCASGKGSDFEKDLFELINIYCNAGLKKPDLINKMHWAIGNCKLS